MKLIGFALAIILAVRRSLLHSTNSTLRRRQARHGQFRNIVPAGHACRFQPRHGAAAFVRVRSRDRHVQQGAWRPIRIARSPIGASRLSQWSNPFAGIKAGPLLERGLTAAQKGLATGQPTPREKAYLAAVNQLYANAATISHRDRTLAYAKAMEAVQRDIATISKRGFSMRSRSNQTALPTDKTYALQLQAAEILEPLWKKYPDHPGLRALHHSCLRRSGAGAEGADRGAPLCRHRAVVTARAAHAVAHLYARRVLAGFGRCQHQVRAGVGAAGRDRRGLARDGLPGLRLSADGAGQEGDARCSTACRASPRS